jgi:hypothetical protein
VLSLLCTLNIPVSAGVIQIDNWVFHDTSYYSPVEHRLKALLLVWVAWSGRMEKI